MDDDSNHPELLSLTTKIVAAHAGSNRLATGELPALIGSVFEALRTVGTVEVEKSVGALVPAVPIKYMAQNARYPSPILMAYAG